MVKTEMADPTGIQPPFDYSPNLINALEQSLSPERLSTYLGAAGADHAAALRLYIWNTEISAAFYGSLQALEITMRNAFHRELAAKYVPNWYDDPRVPLTPRAHEDVETAKKTLQRLGRPADPERIVSELPFGFWVRLLSRGPPGDDNYEKLLWRPALHRAFPNARKGRKDVHRPLPGLRDLRNRIAHHEPIFRWNLAVRYDLILEVIGWICTDTRDWVMHHSNVLEVLARRPP
jgi:hypothetical protein